MNTQSLPTLGEMADSYYNARAARLAAQKEVDGLKGLEDDAERILINYLKAQGLEGAKGHVATAAIKRTKTVMVERDEDGNDIPDDVSEAHPYEEEASCYSCGQPFSIRRAFVYSTSPIRKD